MTLSAKGKLRRIFPTVRHTNREGKSFKTRKFWIEADGADFGISGKPQLVEFGIVTYEGLQSPNYASVDDLDLLKVGMVLRFNFQIKCIFAKNKYNGEERCYTNLTVCSRLEALESRGEYLKRTVAKEIAKDADHAKIVQQAMEMMPDHIQTSPITPF